MLFPETERVIYKQNPLTEVICQLRYPTILKIDTEKPADFQEKIRDEYPLYKDNLSKGINIQVPSELLRAIPQAQDIVNQLDTTERRYEFLSADETLTVGLTRDFVALTNTNYTHWEKLRDNIASIVDTLESVYKPSFFSRIGLRYQNVIYRSGLGLQDIEWKELLRSELLGMLASQEPPLSNYIEDSQSIISLNLEEITGKVRIRHGFATHNESNEQCYFIDADFHTNERTEIQDGLNILNKFNAANRRFFAWCIREKLTKAMEPTRL